MTKRTAWHRILISSLLALVVLAPASARALTTANTLLPAFDGNAYHEKIPVAPSAAADGQPQSETAPGRHVAELHFTLPANQDAQVWLHLDNPRFNHVRLQRDDGKLWLAGTDYPLSWWQQLGGEILFAETLSPTATHRYTLHVEHNAPINSSLDILSEQQMLSHMETTRVCTGLLAGFIAGLIIYAIFLAFNHREYTYLYLAVSTGAIAVMQLNELGTLYPLWPQSPYWNRICSDLMPMISAWFGVLLLRNYLHTPQKLPRLDAWLQKWMWYILLVCMPVAFFNHYQLMLVAFAIPSVLSMTVSFSAIVLRMRQGYGPARVFLLANLLPILFGTLLFLTFTGMLPHSPLTTLLPLTGTAAQLLLFALALGNRMNWLQEQQARAERQALRSRSETLAKKNFLAQVTHELRTPLIGIMGLADLLEQGKMADGDRQLLAGLQNSARHLLHMTNDLLDYARLEAGKTSVNRCDFDLHALIARLIDSHQVQAQAKQLTLTSHIGEAVPQYVCSDPLALEKVLTPILDNAIKFTEQGGVFISVSHSGTDNDPAKIRIDILDTGIGFDQLFEQRAFGLFELADQSSTRNAQGAGLGLSLSRHYCELLGGSIHCESEPGKGTLFWIELPVTRATASTASGNHPASAPDHKPASATVLVAEDDPALQMIIADQLTRAGQPHHLFDNGKQLADWYEQHADTPCILLIDWEMPVCNGRETLVRIRDIEQRQQRPAAPVAILTAHDRMPELDDNALRTLPVLHKPLDAYLLSEFLGKATTHPSP